MQGVTLTQSEKAIYGIKAEEQFTRCGWKVKGKVSKVVLRGVTSFEDGKIWSRRGMVRILESRNSEWSYPAGYNSKKEIRHAKTSWADIRAGGEGQEEGREAGGVGDIMRFLRL